VLQLRRQLSITTFASFKMKKISALSSSSRKRALKLPMKLFSDDCQERCRRGPGTDARDPILQRLGDKPRFVVGSNTLGNAPQNE
jgi:hypothetical protein